MGGAHLVAHIIRTTYNISPVTDSELRTQNSEIHFLTQNFTIRYNIAFNMINIT